MAKLLIVDDSPLARLMLKRILVAEGHEVREASNGEDAVEMYRDERPDLVFCDMVMEGMYGVDVAARLREIDPESRVILATADASDATRSEAEAEGVAGFVSKPFALAAIAGAVRAALG